MNSQPILDIFGRDQRLRSVDEQALCSADKYITLLTNMLKNMSWYEISVAFEDEEERKKQEQVERQRIERRTQEQPRIQAITDKRKALLAAGQYELEEGEILE